MKKIWHILAALIALSVTYPAHAERGLFISTSATCADVPSPETDLTYCLPSTGPNKNQLLVYNGAAFVTAIAGTGSAYATVRDEGTVLTQRTTLNLTGAGVTCVDNPGASRTDCDVTAGGGGAPTDVNYLVGTANGSLSDEIVVGTSPGGELGGTWASPTVDATHSGSSHAGVQAAAEATAAAALASHEADTTSIHGIANTALLETTAGAQAKVDTHVNDTSAAHQASAIAFTPNGSIAATDVQAAIQEVRDEAGAGSGDVVGPASAVNNRVVFFDGTTGKLIKDSGLTLSGSNTGDQTITLTGDVTGSGTGSFATTIAADAVALGTDTTGNYVSSATANQGLLLTGTEGASLGLIDCAANEILKRNAGDTAWECAADAGGGSGTVNTGATGALSYYPSAGTTVDDTGITYDSGTLTTTFPGPVIIPGTPGIGGSTGVTPGTPPDLSTTSKGGFYISSTRNQPCYVYNSATCFDMGTFVSVPATAGSTGKVGQFSADANYFYIAYGTNTWIRVAADTGWLTTLILDQFTDTNAVGLASHTIAPTNTPATSWTVGEGTAEIQGNKARVTTGGVNSAHVDAGISDGTFTVTVRRDANVVDAALMFRYLDTNNYWFADLQTAGTDTGTFSIYEKTGGTYTEHQHVQKTFTDGTDFVIRVVLSGNNITATVDGGSQLNHSSSVGATRTKHGIWASWGGVGTVHDFENFTVQQ